MSTSYTTRRPHQVISAGPDLDKDLADLLAYALQEKAPYTALVTDNIARREDLPAYFVHMLETARTRRWLVCTFDDQAGIALWAEHTAEEQPGPGADPAPALPDTPSAAAIAKFELAREAERARVMAGREHVHLHTLCARFTIKGAPIESALLAERVAALDLQGRPAYADPSREEHRSLLLAHGFHPAAAAEGAPGLIYPMVREPHGP